MSAFVTEPKRRPSTPAFWAMSIFTPSSLAPRSCAPVSCSLAFFSRSTRRSSNSLRFFCVARLALPCGMRKLRAKPSFTFTTSPRPPRFTTFSIRIICMVVSSVQVGEVQEREEARALDRHAQLALVAGLGAGDAGRDDLAVLVHEVLQDDDVLVVDFLDLLGGETAEPAAAEKPPVLVFSVLAFGELAAATLAATPGGRCHVSFPLTQAAAGCAGALPSRSAGFFAAGAPRLLLGLFSSPHPGVAAVAPALFSADM